jgi:mannose-6-phosphate isomerase-like protein (cupin superfamily)
MHYFDVDVLPTTAEHPYAEFLREPSMSAGIYRLEAGGVDLQQPHTEDELYYVISGRGHIRVGDEARAVGPGSLIYVPALVEHRFFDIEAALTILVCFSPAEYSRRSPSS